jgi:hypothetical protein
VSIYPQREVPAGLKHLDWQRLPQWPLGGEQLTDRVGTRPDPACLVPAVHQLVQLGQRVDLGHRDEVVAAKPPDLPLRPALPLDGAEIRRTVLPFGLL